MPATKAFLTACRKFRRFVVCDWPMIKPSRKKTGTFWETDVILQRIVGSIQLGWPIAVPFGRRYDLFS
jgi:hypothetical protein